MHTNYATHVYTYLNIHILNSYSIVGYIHVYTDIGNHRIIWLLHAQLAIFIFYVYLSAARMEWVCIQNMTPPLSKFLYPFHYVLFFIRCKFNMRGTDRERLIQDNKKTIIVIYLRIVYSIHRWYRFAFITSYIATYIATYFNVNQLSWSWFLFHRSVVVKNT